MDIQLIGEVSGLIAISSQHSSFNFKNEDIDSIKEEKKIIWQAG